MADPAAEHLMCLNIAVVLKFELVVDVADNCGSDNTAHLYIDVEHTESIHLQVLQNMDVSGYRMNC